MAMTEAALRRHLQEEPLKPVYFLYGEEPYLTAYYADQLARHAVGDDPMGEFNLQRLDGQSCSLETIEEAAVQLPVMAERKCVLVQDLDVAKLPAGETDRLLSLLSDPLESCVLVFWQSSVEADVKKNAKWKKFLAAVERAGMAVGFPRKTTAELQKLLCAGAARRGCVLSPDTAKALVERCGDDLYRLMNELDKLCALADGGEITVRQVEQMTAPQLEASVFDLSRAILQGSHARAYEILRRLAAEREEPVMVLGVLGSAYADLYRAKVAQLGHARADSLSASFAYRGREFRLRNAARDCERLSIRSLRESLEVLAWADRQLKSSAPDKWAVLEQAACRLIARIR